MFILLPNNRQIILYRKCAILRNSKHTVLFDKEHSKSGIHYFLYFLTLNNSYIDVWKKKKKKSQSFKNEDGSDLESGA